MRGRTGTFVHWALLAAGLAASLALAVVAYRVASYSWSQVAEYRGPFSRMSVASPHREGPRAARRVVLVIVDGLRADVSQGLRTMGSLRSHGADLVLETPQPSLSYPDWTTILSGAPPQVSGVTTNDFDRHVPVPTLLDSALKVRRRVVVVGPRGFDTLFGASRATASYFEDWREGEYLSGRLVDETLRLVASNRPDIVLLHLPDVDEAGHDFGGASVEYRTMAERVDTDLGRLVTALQDGRTAFVVVSDHGHVDAGGHGGWEPDATMAPAVFAGSGVSLGQGTGRLIDLAPTVAVLAGLEVPSHSAGEVLGRALVDRSDARLASARAQEEAFASAFVGVVQEGSPAALKVGARPSAGSGGALRAWVSKAQGLRLADERRLRAPMALGLAGAVLVLFLVLGLASWRALVSALAGVAAYNAVYSTLYFVVHRLRWSLSALNSEDRMTAFFNMRMAEAIAAGLVAAAVAALVYPLLRKSPQGPREQGRLAGWLALGPATVLAVQATLAVEAAWYLWRWGVTVTWLIPDLRAAFKYDLDLVQATALGGAAILAPLVTYLVGRYHPRVGSRHTD
ncbi:MAG: alkaline phosphatase family protein [Coriobacteriia bacterium]